MKALTVRAWFLAAVLLAAPHALRAQCDESADSGSRIGSSTVYLGSRRADALRTGNDLGGCAAGGSLIRSSLSLSVPLGPGDRRLRYSAITPRLQTAWNSSIPESENDGAMWSGRGLSWALSAGGRLEYGPLTVVLAPEFTTSANEVTPTLSPTDADRGPFASPWHSGLRSIDLPQRMGDRRFTAITPGLSAVEVRGHGAAAGVTAEDLWWGPGVGNALVMSNNAAGIPQIYVRTASPVATRAGDVEARVLLGGLSESPYFDTNSHNNLRAISAGVATLRLALDTGLTLGIAHSVYAPGSGVASHWHDVFTDWTSPDTTGGVKRGGAQSIASVFGRWVFPASGFETYGEWATLSVPGSLRALIVAPQRHQGFTLGFQWLRPLHRGSQLRIQGELTTLEQTPDPTGGPTPEFYLSESAVQGYTQRGQVVGAAIGPGSSDQWLACDLLRARWELGVIAGRVRSDDDAYEQMAATLGPFSHDVSLFAGVRGGATIAGMDVSAAVTETKRLNYLFQTAAYGYNWNSAFDVHNLGLRLTFLPRL